MDAPEEWETTDIVICGCGPTGAMLSAYLGRMSVTNIVLEKESDITTDPRGIALDEEGIRLVQGLGIYDHIYKTIGTCRYLDNRPLMFFCEKEDGLIEFGRYVSIQVRWWEEDGSQY
jgi:hypothetical protein